MTESETKTIELVGGLVNGKRIRVSSDFSSKTILIPYFGSNGLEELAYSRNPGFPDRYDYSPAIRIDEKNC